MQPENSNHDVKTDGDILENFCALLQPLPSLLRYYDDFADTVRSIKSPSDTSCFPIHFYGNVVNVDFGWRQSNCGLILKHVLAMMLEQDLASATIATYFSNENHLKDQDIKTLLLTEPLEIGLLWAEWRARDWTAGVYILAKHVLHLFCTYRWNGWSGEYRAFLSTSLPLPAVDKHAAVRSGNVFLSVDQESMIVRHIDEIATNIKRGVHMPHPAVFDAAMLICAYQFAMRPVQIATLDARHVRIWKDELDSDPTVHLTFHMAKQRQNESRIPLTRRVKREWACIFVHLQTVLYNIDASPTAKFFQVTSSREAGLRIAALTRSLINSDELGTAMDLRHSAAQRLVDAGASHEELAEFLGHAHTNTGLIYFATSANHAERVNRALGASETYRKVAKIAHDRFISPDELSSLKEEQQIAAVPHGVPIAGIGGCKSGQPACPYNPITSCYGCRKFMPTTDLKLHTQVLTDMREVVLLFESSSRADSKSPAYMQLQRTISEIQTVIGELEGGKE